MDFPRLDTALKNQLLYSLDHDRASSLLKLQLSRAAHNDSISSAQNLNDHTEFLLKFVQIVWFHLPEKWKGQYPIKLTFAKLWMKFSCLKAFGSCSCFLRWWQLKLLSQNAKFPDNFYALSDILRSLYNPWLSRFSRPSEPLLRLCWDDKTRQKLYLYHAMCYILIPCHVKI